MQCVEGDHKIKTAIVKRQAYRAALAEKWTDLFLGVFDGIVGDIDSNDLNPRTGLHQVVQQKTFAAANVENSVARFDSVMLDDCISNLPPPAIVRIAPIARLAVAIPVVHAPLFCERGCFSLREFNDTGNVVALRALVDDGEKIDVCHLPLVLRIIDHAPD